MMVPQSRGTGKEVNQGPKSAQLMIVTISQRVLKYVYQGLVYCSAVTNIVEGGLTIR